MTQSEKSFRFLEREAFIKRQEMKYQCPFVQYCKGGATCPHRNEHEWNDLCRNTASCPACKPVKEEKK